jgi:hypothetical protein
MNVWFCDCYVWFGHSVYWLSTVPVCPCLVSVAFVSPHILQCCDAFGCRTNMLRLGCLGGKRILHYKGWWLWQQHKVMYDTFE